MKKAPPPPPAKKPPPPAKKPSPPQPPPYPPFDTPITFTTKLSLIDAGLATETESVRGVSFTIWSKGSAVSISNITFVLESEPTAFPQEPDTLTLWWTSDPLPGLIPTSGVEFWRGKDNVTGLCEWPNTPCPSCVEKRDCTVAFYDGPQHLPAHSYLTMYAYSAKGSILSFGTPAATSSTLIPGNIVADHVAIQMYTGYTYIYEQEWNALEHLSYTNSYSHAPQVGINYVVKAV